MRHPAGLNAPALGAWPPTLGPTLTLALILMPRSVGAELAALAPQRVLDTAGEEPEGQDEPPRGSRTPVGRQWLVVLRHGQRIDEARCHGWRTLSIGASSAFWTAMTAIASTSSSR